MEDNSTMADLKSKPSPLTPRPIIYPAPFMPRVEDLASEMRHFDLGHGRIWLFFFSFFEKIPTGISLILLWRF